MACRGAAPPLGKAGNRRRRQDGNGEVRAMTPIQTFSAAISPAARRIARRSRGSSETVASPGGLGRWRAYNVAIRGVWRIGSRHSSQLASDRMRASGVSRLRPLEARAAGTRGMTAVAGQGSQEAPASLEALRSGHADLRKRAAYQGMRWSLCCRYDCRSRLVLVGRHQYRPLNGSCGLSAEFLPRR